MLGVGGQQGEADGGQQQMSEGEVSLDGVVSPPDVPEVGVGGDQDQTEAGGAEIPVHGGHGAIRGQHRGQESQGEETGGQEIVQVTPGIWPEILNLDDIQKCHLSLRL